MIPGPALAWIGTRILDIRLDRNMGVRSIGGKTATNGICLQGNINLHLIARARPANRWGALRRPVELDRVERKDSSSIRGKSSAEQGQPESIGVPKLPFPEAPVRTNRSPKQGKMAYRP